MRFGEQLELCILIQKQSNPDGAGSWQHNSFVFVKKVDGFDYLNRELKDHIFDQAFVDFLKPVQEGDRYFDFSEKMMQVIESVDPLYKALIGKGAPIDVHKPMLVRRLLDTLDGRYDGYLRLSDEDRLKRVITLYAEMLAERGR